MNQKERKKERKNERKKEEKERIWEKDKEFAMGKKNG